MAVAQPSSLFSAIDVFPVPPKDTPNCDDDVSCLLASVNSSWLAASPDTVMFVQVAFPVFTVPFTFNLNPFAVVPIPTLPNE